MNLKKRFFTAAILLGVVFGSIQYLPKPGFFVVIQILILSSLIEFYNLCRKKAARPQIILGIFIALLIGFSFYFREFPTEMALFAGLLILSLYYVISIRTVESVAVFPQSVALTFFGALYLGITLNFFLWMREDFGPFPIYFFLVIIFVGDSGAYFFGKLWGRHKLAPIASPHKTWEGSFGGIITGCLGGIVAALILLKEVSLWKVVLVAFLVHAVAQFSDPMESLFKRAGGVKDSSNLLPGHGGFLDRVDSLILAAPLFYYLMKFFGLS